MKHISAAFFLALFFISTSIHASDSLKVKKVSFFVEPKFMVNVPTTKTTTTRVYDLENVPSPGDDYNLKTTTHKNPVFSVGLAVGMSVKLSKHLFYQFSVSYYFNNQSTKITQTQTYLASPAQANIYTTSAQSSYNYMGLGNGISYKCNKFSFTHTVLLYQAINYTQSTFYTEQNSHGYFTQSDFISGNAVKDGLDIKIMSEHKVGYSFLNDRIEPFVGVNFNWSSSFYTFKGNTQFKPVWLPFASVKINF